MTLLREQKERHNVRQLLYQTQIMLQRMWLQLDSIINVTKVTFCHTADLVLIWNRQHFFCSMLKDWQKQYYFLSVNKCFIQMCLYYKTVQALNVHGICRDIYGVLSRNYSLIFQRLVGIYYACIR